MTHTSSRVCSDKVDDVGWCVDVSNKAIAWVMATSMGQKKTKKDVEKQLERVRKPIDGDYTPLTDEEIKINFLPLVVTLAHKQSTSDQA